MRSSGHLNPWRALSFGLSVIVAFSIQSGLSSAQASYAYVSTRNVSCTTGQTLATCGQSGLTIDAYSWSGYRQCARSGSLPSGIRFDTATRTFLGTFSAQGSWTYSETWSWSCGYADSTEFQFNFTVTSPPVTPVVNSSLSKSATVGEVMQIYVITGSNNPTSYNATSLPSGLGVNTATGQISGTPTTAGTFNSTISATNSAGTGSATLTFTVATGTQSTLALSATSAMFGMPFTLSPSGGSGTGAVSFSLASAGTAGCTMPSATTLSATSVGNCTVTVAKALDANYNSASADVPVNFGPANQPAVLLDSVRGTFGTDLPLAASGGSGTGTVSFVVTAAGNAGCSLVTATTLTSTGAGTCSVRVDKASEANYNAASSAVTTVTLAARTQPAAVILTSLGDKSFGSALTLSASGGSGIGAYSYSVVNAGSAGCSIAGDQLTSTGDVGSTCIVRATRVADANNLSRDSDPQTITVATKSGQPTLSMNAPVITFRVPVSLSSAGGAGSGAVTYAVTTAGTAGCSIVAGELRTTGDVGTTCGVTATKAASTNYLQAVSSEVTVTVTVKAVQSITFVAPADRDYTTMPFTAVATSDSDLTVGLTSATPSICSAAGLSVTMLLPGTCILDADQAGNTNFLGASTLRSSFEIAPAAQAVTWNPTAGVLSTASPLTMTTAAGSDGGAIQYSVIDAGLTHCAIADPTLPIMTFSSAGSCTLQAEAAATATHQAGSSVKVFVIAAPPVASSSGGTTTTSATPGLVVVKVRSLDPIVENGGLAPGSQLVTVDGHEVPVRIEANPTSTGLDVIGTGWSLSLVAQKSDGSPSPLAPGGVLIVTAGSRIDVTGSGFDDLSQVRIYALSRPVHLGSLMSDHIGDVSGSVVAPADLQVGSDTLQINGFSTDRVVRSVSVGVQVAAAGMLKPSSVGSRVYFPYKSAVLTAKAKRSLMSMISQMPTGTSAIARVTGALRSTGATSLDRSLAVRRAAVVSGFLKAHGVSGSVTSSVRRVAVHDRYRDRRVDISVRLTN